MQPARQAPMRKAAHGRVLLSRAAIVLPAPTVSVIQRAASPDWAQRVLIDVASVSEARNRTVP